MAVRVAQLFGKRDDICTPLGSTRFATYCSSDALTTKTLCCADTTRTFPQCLTYNFDENSISWCCVGDSDTDNCYAFFEPAFWEQTSGSVSCAASDATGNVVAYCPYLTSCVRTWSAPLNSDELVQCQLPQGALQQLNAPAPSSSTSDPPAAPSSTSPPSSSSTLTTPTSAVPEPSSSSTSSSSSSEAPPSPPSSSTSSSSSSSSSAPAAASSSSSSSLSSSSDSSLSSSISSIISSTASHSSVASTSSTTAATGVIPSDTSPSSTSTNLPATTSSNSSSLSSGALAGIILGAILGVALLGILVFWLFWRRPKDKFAANPPSGYNSAAPGTEVGPLGSQQRSPVAMSNNGRVYEIDNKQKFGYRG